MLQSNVTQDARVALTSRVIAAKAIKDLSFAELAEGTGYRVAYITAALLGQHALSKDAAELVAGRRGLDAGDAKQLQAVPLRGSIRVACRPTRPSTASTIGVRIETPLLTVVARL